MTSTTQFQSKSAFVTGAGSGIGAAVATRLGAAGMNVTCADLDRDSAAATAARIRGAGGEARGIELDVARRDHVFSQVDDAVNVYGSLDVMCNIAGIPGDLTTVEDLDEGSFDRIFQIHFKGTFYGCHAALPHMIASGSGSIINTASSAIDLAVPTTTSYSVAKAAITMLTRTLAGEVGHHGIRANVVAPGFVPTPLSMVSNNSDRAERDSYLDRWAQRSPMNRVGTVDDISAQFLYLAAEDSSFVTGQILRANGGATMPW